VKRPNLISVDELRAMGALDVPPEYRKSLGGNKHAKPNTLPGFVWDDDLSDDVAENAEVEDDNDEDGFEDETGE
jgi:hypothetical protein